MFQFAEFDITLFNCRVNIRSAVLSRGHTEQSDMADPFDDD